MNTLDLSSIYSVVHELLEVKSKSDPAGEPYKCKYDAREKLEIIKKIINTKLDKIQSTENHSSDQDNCTLLKAQLAAVYVHLGIIGLETEELSTGQEQLEKANEVIAGVGMSSKFISVAILCNNNLAILWAQRDEQKLAHDYLEKSLNLYTEYRNRDKVEPPVPLHELFISDLDLPDGWKILEKYHTLTLYYLAQVEGKLGFDEKSANLCLKTLQRQLTFKDYQRLSWSINAATLSKFYHDNQKYKLARRLLAAAWTILKSDQISEDSSQQIEENQYDETKAEVAHRWGIFSVAILQDSYDALSAAEEGSTSTSAPDETSNTTEEAAATALSETESLDKMGFCELELSTLEEESPCELAKDYDDAKRIFTCGLRWLDEARAFFTLENYATSHANVAQHTSTLYKLLASFDKAPDRRSKMHKRRINLLTPILEELNSQYYLGLCRQLDYELGETYSAMVDCKYEVLNGQTPTTKQAAKINNLSASSRKHFTHYLGSFKPADGEELSKYPEDSERPVMVAKFHIGRLWGKAVASSPAEVVLFNTNSLMTFKSLVDYCDEHSSAATLMSLELPVCREMVALLPYKIERLKRQHNITQ